MAADATRRLAKQLTPRREQLSTKMRYGVVTAIDDAAYTVTVTLGGDATPLAGISYDPGYVPRVGEEVLIEQWGRDLRVVGATSALMLGNLTKGRVPAVRLWRNADKSIAALTGVAIDFTTELYDTDGMWASSPNPTRVTIGAPGVYGFAGAAAFQDSSARRTLEIKKNGNGILDHDDRTPPSATGMKVKVAGAAALLRGEYLELVFFHFGGGPGSVLSQSEHSPVFSVWYVGPHPAAQ